MNKKQAREFQEMLLKFSQENDPATRQKLEDDIWERYGTEQAAFVLDMSGFSLLTRKHGIVHYLSMVRRMQMIAEPIIKTHGGKIIKFEADNCYAVFPDTLPALNVAIALQRAFYKSNLLTSDDLNVHIACGIDYGKILVVGEEDFFGDTVNRACKLGEDVAAAGEILITHDALERIPANMEVKRREVNVSISGILIRAYSIEYRVQN